MSSGLGFNDDGGSVPLQPVSTLLDSSSCASTDLTSARRFSQTMKEPVHRSIAPDPMPSRPSSRSGSSAYHEQQLLQQQQQHLHATFTTVESQRHWIMQKRVAKPSVTIDQHAVFEIPSGTSSHPPPF